MAVFTHVLNVLAGRSPEEIARTRQEMEQLTTSARESGRELSQVTRSASRMARGVGRLSSVIDVLSPGLGEGAKAAQTLGYGLNVAELGLSSFSKGSIGALSALSAIAVAAAAAATAYAVYANATQDARLAQERLDAAVNDTTAAMNALNTAANAFRQIGNTTAGFIGDLQIQTALLRGEIDQADVAAGKLGGTLADDTRASVLALGQALESTRARTRLLVEAVNAPGVSGAKGAAIGLQIEESKKAEEAIAAQLDAAKRLQDEGRAAIDAYTQATKDKEKADRDAADASKRVAAGDREAARALAERERAAAQAAAELERLQTLVDAINPRATPADAAGRGRAATDAIRTSGASPAEQSALLGTVQREVTAGTLAEIKAAFGELDDALAGFSDGLSEMIAEMAQARRDLRDQRIEGLFGVAGGDPTAIVGALGGAFQKTGAGLIGGAAGGLGIGAGMAGGLLSAAAGPAGMILGGLASIGQSGGAAGVRQQVEAMSEAILIGIEALPEILIDVIPAFVNSLVRTLPRALAEALVEGLRRLIQSFLAIIFPNRFDGKSSGQQQGAVRTASGSDFDAAYAAAQQAGSINPAADAMQALQRERDSTAARSYALQGAGRVLMARSARQAMRGSGAVVNIQALSVDQDFAMNAAGRLGQLTDPTFGLRRGGA